ncbi:MAG: hypothetical protein HY903_23120 [Deltaproteobacteria bacterium]|nr:hypothetical protein [Deltaproteobacteria bacterium]
MGPRPSLIVALLAIEVGGACAGAVRGAPGAPAAPGPSAIDAAFTARFREAEDLYQNGQVAQAAALFDGIADTAVAPDSKAQAELVGKAMDRAVACYQELANDQRSRPVPVAEGVPIPIQGVDADVVRAAERARKHLGDDSPRATELGYVLGRIYYVYNRHDQALAAFAPIVERHPESELACGAASLTLDIYNGRQDYALVADTAQAFLRDARLVCDDKQRASFERLLAGASFKLIEADAQEGAEPGAVAAAYLAFADKFVGSELVCPAIHNASVSYRAAERPADESRVRKLLLRRCSEWMKRKGS